MERGIKERVRRTKERVIRESKKRLKRIFGLTKIITKLIERIIKEVEERYLELVTTTTINGRVLTVKFFRNEYKRLKNLFEKDREKFIEELREWALEILLRAKLEILLMIKTRKEPIEIERRFNNLFNDLNTIFKEISDKIAVLEQEKFENAFQIFLDPILQLVRDRGFIIKNLRALNINFFEGLEGVYLPPNLESFEEFYELFYQALCSLLSSHEISLPPRYELNEKIFYVHDMQEDLSRKEEGVYSALIQVIMIFPLPPEIEAKREGFDEDEYFPVFTSIFRLDTIIHELLHFYSYQEIEYRGKGRFEIKRSFSKNLNEAITQLITLILLREIINRDERFNREKEYIEEQVKYLEKWIKEIKEKKKKNAS